MIKVEGLKKSYGKQKILKGISLEIFRGETVGLVGESGSGKSTFAKLLMRLQEPTAGSITYDSVDLCRLNRKGLKPYRKKIQMVFQDPYSSLNPRMTIEQILSEPLTIHHLPGSPLDLLKSVGLSADCLTRYPHAFSGGQRQRIAIARALAVQPELLICDEPISALDMATQHQILLLFQELQKTHGLTTVFISHDLLAVRELCTRIAVMQDGELVEVAPTNDLFLEPKHPYTQRLLDAIL